MNMADSQSISELVKLLTSNGQLPPIQNSQPVSLSSPPVSRLNMVFSALKSNLELTPTFDQLIQQRHNAVRSVIENNGHPPNTKLIGSLQRETRIHPRKNDEFDIDVLVILGEFTGWVSSGGISPYSAMENLRGMVTESERYDAMNPAVDQPTVFFEYSDGTKVEIVPAYLDKIGYSSSGAIHTPTGRSYWVPKNGQWILADYDHEANHITEQNKLTNGWLIPTIKMLKAIKREHLDEMLSFHLEILAAMIIPNAYSIRKQQGLKINYPTLISDFFGSAQRLITSPVRMPGSNSPTVELKLLHQPKISQAVNNIKLYIDKINSEASETARIASWRTLFGEVFPAP